MSIIRVKNLTKDFNRLRAVDNISFEVRKGKIFGLIDFVIRLKQELL